mmetsp:Transcript_75408/g.157191  ORF Transcript_75408/g.157191 Transcript_75408/m.157191 type:complete len:201 (-) Transcript_75408:1434-2036(-)
MSEDAASGRGQGNCLVSSELRGEIMTKFGLSCNMLGCPLQGVCRHRSQNQLDEGAHLLRVDLRQSVQLILAGVALRKRRLKAQEGAGELLSDVRLLLRESVGLGQLHQHLHWLVESLQPSLQSLALKDDFVPQCLHGSFVLVSSLHLSLILSFVLDLLKNSLLLLSVRLFQRGQLLSFHLLSGHSEGIDSVGDALLAGFV